MLRPTEVIESRIFRIVLLLIGIISLPVILVSAVHGYVFLYSAMNKFEPIALGLGLATLLGLPGFFAACYRLLKKRKNMGRNEVLYLRLCLYSGIVASALLLAIVVHFKLGVIAIGFLVALILGGFAFVSATPKGI